MKFGTRLAVLSGMRPGSGAGNGGAVGVGATSPIITGSLQKAAMSTDQRSNENLKDVTDAEIHSAIRYLDPDIQAESAANSDESLLVICIALLVLLLGFAALVWLQNQVHR